MIRNKKYPPKTMTTFSPGAKSLTDTVDPSPAVAEDEVVTTCQPSSFKCLNALLGSDKLVTGSSSTAPELALLTSPLRGELENKDRGN